MAAIFLVAVAAPAFACDTSAWIETDPTSGGPGTAVNVHGEGFEPGTVEIRWDRSSESGGAVLGQAEVGPDGTLSAQVVIPEDAPGRHMIIAEHLSSSESVAHAEAWQYFEIPGAATPSEESSPQQGSPANEQSQTGTEDAGAQPAQPRAERTSESASSSQPQVLSDAVPVAAVAAEAAPAAAERAHQGRVQGPVTPLTQRLSDPTPREAAAAAGERSVSAVADAPVLVERQNERSPWAPAFALIAAAALVALAFRRRAGSRPPADEADVDRLRNPEDTTKPDELAA